MTLLDDRGRDAARAIHDSVSGCRPEAARVLARRRTIWQAAQFAAGAVAVAGLIAFVALVTDPREEDTAQTTTVPDNPVMTTLPSPPTTEAPQVVVPPTVPDMPAPTVPVTTAPTTAPPDTTPPALAITSPEAEAHFEIEVVTFRGTTEPGATVVAAGKFAAAVDVAGNWSIDLVLAPGKNGASFTASDAAGNEARASIVVWLDVVEEPKEEPPVVKDFTASAKFGSCSETPPYDIYYGTGAAGTTVTISSAYGSGSVTVGAEGHWEKKVVFESAPYGEPFLVTVTDHTGPTKSFEFVSYATG